VKVFHASSVVIIDFRFATGSPAVSDIHSLVSYKIRFRHFDILFEL